MCQWFEESISGGKDAKGSNSCASIDTAKSTSRGEVGPSSVEATRFWRLWRALKSAYRFSSMLFSTLGFLEMNLVCDWRQATVNTLGQSAPVGEALPARGVLEKSNEFVDIKKV